MATTARVRHRHDTNAVADEGRRRRWHGVAKRVLTTLGRRVGWGWQRRLLLGVEAMRRRGARCLLAFPEFAGERDERMRVSPMSRMSLMNLKLTPGLTHNPIPL